MVGLGDLPGGVVSSGGQGVAPRGAAVVGYGWADLGYEPFLWTPAGGMQSLGDLPGGAHFGIANAITPDASVVVGLSSSEASGTGSEAFRWDRAFGLRSLGDLSGGIVQSQAQAVSADGWVVVGEATSDLGREAFIWDPIHGTRNLRSVVIAEFGLEAARALAGWTLRTATAISADGTVIAGNGINPLGQSEAWVARVMPFCYANCDGSTVPPVLNVNDFACFLTAFATGSLYANCDGSTTAPAVNVADLICFNEKFASGCP